MSKLDSSFNLYIFREDYFYSRHTNRRRCKFFIIIAKYWAFSFVYLQYSSPHGEVLINAFFELSTKKNKNKRLFLLVRLFFFFRNKLIVRSASLYSETPDLSETAVIWLSVILFSSIWYSNRVDILRRKPFKRWLTKRMKSLIIASICRWLFFFFFWRALRFSLDLS